jgi:hypothetical protein
MADETVDEDAVRVTVALAYLRTMHEEAAAIVAALEAERPRVRPARRATARAARRTAGQEGSL